MKILKRITNHKYYMHTKNFSKYLFVGISWSFLNIFLMWLFIDYLKLPTIYGASVVVVILLISKFYAYRLIGFMENKFLKYASTAIGFYLANIFFMWLFVDIVGLSTVISSTIIVFSLFILRFLTFYKVGLIKG